MSCKNLCYVKSTRDCNRGTQRSDNRFQSRNGNSSLPLGRREIATPAFLFLLSRYAICNFRQALQTETVGQR